MKMKKIFRIIISFALIVFSGFSLFCCSKDSEKLYVYMPDGAPALAMSKLMYEDTNLGRDTNYSVVSANNIGNCIIQKSADIAVIPVNMASKLIATGDNYKIVATVTNGNLYVVGNRDITNLSDLKNEVVGVIGQGNVPDLNLKYLLANSDEPTEYVASDEKVDGKVALRYFSAASDLLPMLKQGKLNFGLLPEPAVSKLLSIPNNFNVELDMQALWEGGSYPQAVLVVKKDLCSDTDFINTLITKLTESELWVAENTAEAVRAVNKHLIDGVTPSLQETISANTIANCNIKIHSMTTEEISRIKAYLDGIKTIAPNAIGNYSTQMFYGV